MELAPKPVSYSRTILTELMIPSYANFGGKIHGGILLSLMDKVAYACASRHAGAYCVTVSVDTVDFLKPVEVGELVSLKASVNYVGNSSMIIGIRVEAENVKSGTVEHTNTCYFTLVAKGEDDRPTNVPPLLLQDKKDVRRFIEAMARKKIRKKNSTEMDLAKSGFNLAEEIEKLKEERCVIQLS